jgi:transposase
MSNTPSSRSQFAPLSPRSGQRDESYASSSDIQVVTGLDRRRKWSEELKATIVSESMSPGATVLSVARKYDIHPRAIFRWKAQLIAEAAVAPAPAMLVPLGPKKRGRKPKAIATATALDVVPPPKVFAVAPASAPAVPPDSVRLVIGDLVITIATSNSR